MGSDWRPRLREPDDGTDGGPDRAPGRTRETLGDLFHDDPDDIVGPDPGEDRRRLDLDDEVGDGLTARAVLEKFDPVLANRPDLDPDEAVVHLARRAREQPRLGAITAQDRCVQRIYAVFGQGAFHGTERHEGSMRDEDHLLRLVERHDPAQTDDQRRSRGIDQFKRGNGKHVCADSSTSIADSVAYAVALVRGVDHPRVRAALEAPRDPPKRPYYVQVPIVDLLGENGHEFCTGYQLVGDDPRRAVKERDVWAKAGWRNKPREELRQPRTEPIATFRGGVIEFRFEHNAESDGYELVSMFPRPHADPVEKSRRGRQP